MEQPESAHGRHFNVCDNTGTLGQAVYTEKLLG